MSCSGSESLASTGIDTPPPSSIVASSAAALGGRSTGRTVTTSRPVRAPGRPARLVPEPQDPAETGRRRDRRPRPRDRRRVPTRSRDDAQPLQPVGAQARQNDRRRGVLVDLGPYGRSMQRRRDRDRGSRHRAGGLGVRPREDATNQRGDAEGQTTDRGTDHRRDRDPAERTLGEQGQRPHCEAKPTERDAEERTDDLRVELGSRTSSDLGARVFASIGSLYERAEVITSNTSATETMRAASAMSVPDESRRISGTVPLLVVLSDREHPRPEPFAQRGDDACTDLGVALEDLPLVVGRTPLPC